MRGREDQCVVLLIVSAGREVLGALRRLERDRREEIGAAGEARRDRSQLVQVRQTRLGTVISVAQQVVVHLTDDVYLGANVVLGCRGFATRLPA